MRNYYPVLESSLFLKPFFILGLDWVKVRGITKRLGSFQLNGDSKKNSRHIRVFDQTNGKEIAKQFFWPLPAGKKHVFVWSSCTYVRSQLFFYFQVPLVPSALFLLCVCVLCAVLCVVCCVLCVTAYSFRVCVAIVCCVGSSLSVSCEWGNLIKWVIMMSCVVLSVLNESK